jgi:NhaP-type Na+/H+ or K+/H+ antiporter
MYEELAILALFVFLYSLIAGRIERSAVSGPIVFVTAGIIVGPVAVGWFEGGEIREQLRLLADLTLALILFVDAANADLAVLKRRYQIPLRMLLLGLPGVIALGFGLALVLFGALTLFEAAILGTMLAATDAALGKAVITDPSVPSRIREGLNFESGLNDGLCVPILFILIALDAGGDGSVAPLLLVLQEVGIGLLVGVGLASAGAVLLKYCSQKGWVTDIWMQATVAGLALSCFAVAQELHASGYVAAFTGGIMFGFMTGESTHKYVHAAEGVGETLALLTWLLFGVAIAGQLADLITWQVALYALLSLTIVRVLPMVVVLTGSGESINSRLFLGWFGPRGLASIVFAVIVLDSGLPGAEMMSVVVVTTVFFSLVAHGITAKPLAKWIAAND